MSIRSWDKEWRTASESENNLLKKIELSQSANDAYQAFNRIIQDDFNPENVAEIGCGSGKYLIAFQKKWSDAIYFGMDYSILSVNLYKNAKTISKFQNHHPLIGDIFHTPIQSGSIDFVYNEGVIEHFSDYSDTIQEMYRITKKGGYIMISVPNFYNFVHTLLKEYLDTRFENYPEKSFRITELKKEFLKLGIKNIKWTGWASYWGIRRLTRYCPILYKPIKLLSIIILHIEKQINCISNYWFSRMFGFQIVIIGKK